MDKQQPKYKTLPGVEERYFFHHYNLHHVQHIHQPDFLFRYEDAGVNLEFEEDFEDHKIHFMNPAMIFNEHLETGDFFTKDGEVLVCVKAYAKWKALKNQGEKI